MKCTTCQATTAAAALQQCSACGKDVYCSVECQAQDWVRHARDACIGAEPKRHVSMRTLESIQQEMDAIPKGTDPKSFLAEAEALHALGSRVFTDAITSIYSAPMADTVNRHLASLTPKHITAILQSKSLAEPSEKELAAFTAYHKDFIRVYDILEISQDARDSLQRDNDEAEAAVKFEKILRAAQVEFPLPEDFVRDSDEQVFRILSFLANSSPIDKTNAAFIGIGLEDLLRGSVGTLTNGISWLWNALTDTGASANRALTTKVTVWLSTFARQYMGTYSTFDASIENGERTYHNLVRYVLVAMAVIGLGMFVYCNLETSLIATLALPDMVSKTAAEAAERLANVLHGEQETCDAHVKEQVNIIQKTGGRVTDETKKELSDFCIATSTNPELISARNEQAFFQKSFVQTIGIRIHTMGAEISNKYGTLRAVTKSLMWVGLGAELGLRFIVERILNIGNFGNQVIDDAWFRKYAKRGESEHSVTSAYIYANTIVSLRIVTALPDALFSMYPAFWARHVGQLSQFNTLVWETGFIAGVMYDISSKFGFGLTVTVHWICQQILSCMYAIPWLGDALQMLATVIAENTGVTLFTLLSILSGILSLMCTMAFTYVWMRGSVQSFVSSLVNVATRPESFNIRNYIGWEHIVDLPQTHRRKVILNILMPMTENGTSLWNIWKYSIASWYESAKEYASFLQSPAVIVSSTSGTLLMGYIWRKYGKPRAVAAAAPLEPGDIIHSPRSGRPVRRYRPARK